MLFKFPRGIIVTGTLVFSGFILFLSREDEGTKFVAKATSSIPQSTKSAYGLESSTIAPKMKWNADPLAASGPHDMRPLFAVQRQRRMQLLMTGSPLHYYTMKLGELRALARVGDADAMMQLAEQYTNEDARLRADPDYPVNENTRELAKKYLSEAFAAGRIRAAALMTKQLFEENALEEAYAWRIVSERVGDGVNPVWGSDTNQFASISDSEKAAAQTKASEIMNLLLQTKMREFNKTHPPTQ